MRVAPLGFAVIYSVLLWGCGSDKAGGSPDGGSGTPGSGGSAGSAGSSGGSPGGSGGSLAGSGGSTAGSGGSTGGGAGSGGTLGSDDGGSGEAGMDGGEVQCAVMPVVFPVFDRACWDDTWCSIGFHQTDCCGNRIALGMLHPEIARFEPAEQICRLQYPGCGCPAGPATTDTGQTAADDSLIKVQCRVGACTTYVP